MVLLQIVANGIMNRPETDLKPTCVDIQLHFCYFSCRNFKLSVMDEVHLYIALEIMLNVRQILHTMYAAFVHKHTTRVKTYLI